MLGMSAESHPRLVAKTTADRKVRMVDPAGCLGNNEAKNRSTTTMSGVALSRWREKSLMVDRICMLPRWLVPIRGGGRSVSRESLEVQQKGSE